MAARFSGGLALAGLLPAGCGGDAEAGRDAPTTRAVEGAYGPVEHGGVDLSLENLDVLDGDLRFMEVREGATTYEASPLWPTLEVVTNGGVVVVGNHWHFGGVVGTRHVIDDMAAALVELAAR